MAFRLTPALTRKYAGQYHALLRIQNLFGLNKSIPRNCARILVLGRHHTIGENTLSGTWRLHGILITDQAEVIYRAGSGRHMVYGETEYRFRITKNNLFGGVVFLN
jgi:hypothetical protein